MKKRKLKTKVEEKILIVIDGMPLTLDECKMLRETISRFYSFYL